VTGHTPLTFLSDFAGHTPLLFLLDFMGRAPPRLILAHCALKKNLIESWMGGFEISSQRTHS
jgi:hypothetical protein